MGCRACHGKIVSLHKDRTKTHCKGKKHVLNVKKLFQTKEEDKNTLHAHAEVSEESGGMYGDALSDEAKLTQIKAVKGCLAAGIPLNAMDNPIFRSFLSHCNVDLPHRAHLAKYVPFILAEERKKLQDEIGNRPYAICFDATPWLAECFGLGVRFIDSSGKVRDGRQRGIAVFSSALALSRDLTPRNQRRPEVNQFGMTHDFTTPTSSILPCLPHPLSHARLSHPAFYSRCSVFCT
ncbi:unnamed protein product [Ectocarpus sp. CCAP 1310/34]|nr:unnamed protein product [Ectocarpus sp. CCAP 1310/34]